MTRYLLLGGVTAALLVMIPTAPADEGMWLFNNPPRKHAQGEVRLRRRPPTGSSTCRSRRCASTPAAPARSSPPTGW